MSFSHIAFPGVTAPSSAPADLLASAGSPTAVPAVSFEQAIQNFAQTPVQPKETAEPVTTPQVTTAAQPSPDRKMPTAVQEGPLVSTKLPLVRSAGPTRAAELEALFPKVEAAIEGDTKAGNPSETSSSPGEILVPADLEVPAPLCFELLALASVAPPRPPPPPEKLVEGENHTDWPAKSIESLAGAPDTTAVPGEVRTHATVAAPPATSGGATPAPSSGPGLPSQSGFAAAPKTSAVVTPTSSVPTETAIVSPRTTTMGQDVPVTITVAPRIELNEVAVEIPRDLPTAAVQASTKVQASERSSMEDPSAQNSESSAGNEQADSTQLISNEEHPAILERQAALKSVTGRGVSQDAVNQAHGMYGAKSSLTMPKVEQASEHLHRELQSLPSETNSVSYTADPAGVLMPSAVVPRLDLAKGQTIGQSNFPVNFDQGTVLDQSDETVENIGSSATPAIPVQDLHVDIARAVVELKRLRTDSMSVVLRPDAHTELQLQLQVHPHGVEIEAQYRRGDLDHLQAHWLQLQQSLSPQGIRLGPLLDTSAEQGNSSGRGSFQQPSEGKQTFEEPSGSWLPRVASPAAASRVVAEPVSTSNRILESWA